jgi:NADH dehydrogenase
VEVAGALGELKRHVLPKDYPELDFSGMNIYLVEGLEKLLTGMSEKAGTTAVKSLRKFSVNVVLNTMVKEFDGNRVLLSNENAIETRTVIWAAGVKGTIFNGISKESQLKGRILVDRFNKVRGTENIYAVGDISVMQTQAYPDGHPMLAQVAIQQGRLLGRNLKRIEKSLNPVPFEYKDKGSMATIGRNKAVADLPGNMHFGGLIAWMIWMFIHLVSIIGFRNKIVILSNWVWNYFTYDRGTRLIIRKFIPNWEKKSS